MSAGWLTVMFCNCCADGCDCGCVESCRLVDHRVAAGLMPDPRDAEVTR